jgi:hypothetical protein
MAPSLWQRLGCCLTGHDYSVKSDETRMFLRCNACGRTSRGLVKAEDPTRRRSRLDRTGTGKARPPVGHTHLAAQ